MRQTLFAGFLLCISIAGYGQTAEPVDTVKALDNVRNVLVVQDGNKTTVTADYMSMRGILTQYKYEVNVDENDIDNEFSDNWGMELPFMRGKTPRRSDRTVRNISGCRHIYWGWRFNYGDNGGVKNCFEVGIRDFVGMTWKKGGSEFEIGLGLGFKRFLADDGFSYYKTGDAILLLPTDEGKRVKQSRLDMWSFHVPVLYNQKVGNEVTLTLGGIVNFNTYSKAKTATEENEWTQKITYKGLQQNLLTIDAMAAVHICGAGLYASWSPMKLFKEEYGPALKAWSIGLELDF